MFPEHKIGLYLRKKKHSINETILKSNFKKLCIYITHDVKIFIVLDVIHEDCNKAYILRTFRKGTFSRIAIILCTVSYPNPQKLVSTSVR